MEEKTVRPIKVVLLCEKRSDDPTTTSKKGRHQNTTPYHVRDFCSVVQPFVRAIRRNVPFLEPVIRDNSFVGRRQILTIVSRPLLRRRHVSPAEVTCPGTIAEVSSDYVFSSSYRFHVSNKVRG